MAKQKTKKAARKRFTVSATGKFKRRTARQAHFNARANGNQTRRKHADKAVDSSDERRVRDLLPYA